MRNLVLLLALFGCAKAPAAADPVEVPPDVLAVYDETADRLVSMLDRGFVVSRYEDGTTEHTGDALIWSGVAMAALDCARGAPIEAALVAMLQEMGGKIYRHPDKKGSASMDGALGLYRGIASRARRCPGSSALWAPAVALPGFSDNHLNDAEPGSVIVAEFTYVRDELLAHLVETAHDPSVARLRVLEEETAAWAAGVNASHKSCFRVHLGLLALETVQDLGGDVHRNAFCASVRGMDMPSVAAFCGDAQALPAYLASFRYDEWEMRLQRCGAWESPDGTPGLHTPALDRLVALRAAYALAD